MHLLDYNFPVLLTWFTACNYRQICCSVEVEILEKCDYKLNQVGRELICTIKIVSMRFSMSFGRCLIFALKDIEGPWFGKTV